ncbi:MAG: AbrB/MazE/SpoVT family DNA-binding domain-containing protein [Alphaproteobacteria bacterium]|nr:AbrB/MazE/SpoVT family DNA-binding domain-containing protein [Alphaproteobacteria bacterium]
MVKIGNSRGVRIPKSIIEQCGLGDRVEMTVKGRTVQISAETKVRAGWREAFKKAGAGEEELLFPEDMSNEWDDDEWRW